MSTASGKSFHIPKQQVMAAWEQVRANRGGPGVDGVTIEQFEKDLKNNLYKVWNRMCSGSYFPPAVRLVEIPKPGGGTRMLGVPTVADRVAQTVVANYLMGRVEPLFHPDSFGYRPGRSALDAVEVTRQRCRKKPWVVDCDIQGFFDNVDHDLMIRAVAANTDLPWVLLYVRRWLTAPVRHADGTVVARDVGTPQGSAVSPVLANLFLHYAFDQWMARQFPGVEFARYADDIVIHAYTREQAEQILQHVQDRMIEVGLRVHPDKTKVVFCQDGKRRAPFPVTSFVFLGFLFAGQPVRNSKNGSTFLSFRPRPSPAALARMGHTVRRWQLHHRTGTPLESLAAWINPIVRGWHLYYGAQAPQVMRRFLTRINTYLMRWARGKLPATRLPRPTAVVAAVPAGTPRDVLSLGHHPRLPGDEMRRAV